MQLVAHIKKLYKYSVIYSNNKVFETNDLKIAEKRAILNNGTIYEQTRHEALKRLQRIMFKQVNYKGVNIDKFDFSYLLTIEKN